MIIPRAVKLCYLISEFEGFMLIIYECKLNISYYQFKIYLRRIHFKHLEISSIC